MKLSPEALSGIRIFSDLGLEEREQIAPKIRCKNYSAESLIVSRHNESADVFFIISGTVRVTNFSMRGKEVSYRDESAGEILGELSALDGLSRSADLIALEETFLGSMSAENFKLLLRTYPSVSEKLFSLMATKIRALSQRIFEYGTLGINNRLHAELLRLARDTDSPETRAIISPPPKHSVLAARICTHREAVTKELNRLSRANIISKSRSELIINDIEELQQLVDKGLGVID